MEMMDKKMEANMGYLCMVTLGAYRDNGTRNGNYHIVGYL